MAEKDAAPSKIKRRHYRRPLTFSDRLLIATTGAQAEGFAHPEIAETVSTIYHYTDPRGLVGVLSHDQLWATDIRFLNDSAELVHAERIQKEVLEQIRSDRESGAVEKLLAGHPDCVDLRSPSR